MAAKGIHNKFRLGSNKGITYYGIQIVKTIYLLLLSDMSRSSCKLLHYVYVVFGWQRKRAHLSFVDFNRPAAPLVIVIVGSFSSKHSTWSVHYRQSVIARSCNEH